LFTPNPEAMRLSFPKVTYFIFPIVTSINFKISIVIIHTKEKSSTTQKKGAFQFSGELHPTHAPAL